MTTIETNSFGCTLAPDFVSTFNQGVLNLGNVVDGPSLNTLDIYYVAQFCVSAVLEFVALLLAVISYRWDNGLDQGRYS